MLPGECHHIVRLAADKVLLNDRDPVRWDESVRNAILQADLFRPNSPGICLPKGYVWGSGGSSGGGRELLQLPEGLEVISKLPAARLLVWQVKEGWGPLCTFVGLPVPEEPFPNVNDTPSVLRKIGIIKKVVLGTWAVTAVGQASAVY